MNTHPSIWSHPHAAEQLEQVRSHSDQAVWISSVPALLTPVQGPLTGVSFGIKDNIDLCGIPTTAGCPDYAQTPDVSACVVERLIAAGAVPLGKTNMDQFATGLVGTRSPYGIPSSVFDQERISGGSSSGSAVAVALGDCDFALGTDTAGSGRVPAAFNGLVGLKPTRGLVSARGVVPACRSLDCVSFLTRTVAQAQALLAVCAVYDPLDPFARALDLQAGHRAAKRFGVPPASQLQFFGDAHYQDLFWAAVAHTQALGFERVEIDFEPFEQAAALLYSGPWVAERDAAVGDFIATHPDAVHPVVARIIQGAQQFRATDAFRAMYELARLRRLTETAWEQMDFMLLPTAPTHDTIRDVLADPIRLNSRLGTYTNFVNLLDLCALALPAGITSTGLPFGVTLMAQAGEDLTLLEIGHLFESGLSGHVTGGSAQIRVAVVGAHLTGQPLNGQLTSRGARLVRTAKTASGYRLYELCGVTPRKPGMVWDADFAGPGIEVEVWSMNMSAFGSFVALVPAPLSIGTVQMADGESVKGFLCEPAALAGATEITSSGGWRRWLHAQTA